jgi:hypothetical protein
MHVRGQIREAFRVIVTGIPAFASSTYFDSDEVPSEAELPVAIVALGNEDISHESLGGGSAGAILRRECAAYVDILHQARADALLAAEDYAALIEAAIATDTALLALIHSVFVNGYTVTRDDDGAQPTVNLRLEYLITYVTNERDATVAIP